MIVLVAGKVVFCWLGERQWRKLTADKVGGLRTGNGHKLLKFVAG